MFSSFAAVLRKLILMPGATEFAHHEQSAAGPLCSAWSVAGRDG
jgi:hypothetical protein